MGRIQEALRVAGRVAPLVFAVGCTGSEAITPTTVLQTPGRPPIIATATHSLVPRERSTATQSSTPALVSPTESPTPIIIPTSTNTPAIVFYTPTRAPDTPTRIQTEQERKNTYIDSQVTPLLRITDDYLKLLKGLFHNATLIYALPYHFQYTDPEFVKLHANYPVAHDIFNRRLMTEVAPDHPDVVFVNIDDMIAKCPPNVSCYQDSMHVGKLVREMLFKIIKQETDKNQKTKGIKCVFIAGSSTVYNMSGDTDTIVRLFPSQSYKIDIFGENGARIDGQNGIFQRVEQGVWRPSCDPNASFTFAVTNALDAINTGNMLK